MAPLDGRMAEWRGYPARRYEHYGAGGFRG